MRNLLVNLILKDDLNKAFNLARATNDQELMMMVGELMYCPVTEYKEMEEDIVNYIKTNYQDENVSNA